MAHWTLLVALALLALTAKDTLLKLQFAGAPSEEEEVKKVYPPIWLPICPYLTTPPSPDHYGAIVTVTARCETSEETIHAYEGLLKHYSSYFRTALKKEWTKGQSKVIVLAEDSPRVLKDFFEWLYTGKLFAQLTPEGKIPLGFQDICELYVFGDARGIPELCNASIDLLFQKSAQECYFCKEVLNYIYDNTPHACPLRSYMVDFAAEKGNMAILRVDEDMWPKDFLVDVLQRLDEIREIPGFLSELSVGDYADKKQEEICREYHDHSAAEHLNTGLEQCPDRFKKTSY